MNAATPTRPETKDQVRQTETCSARHHVSEDDRVFEARLQWFLAVSRAA
jgi:hypothetical protein